MCVNRGAFVVLAFVLKMLGVGLQGDLADNKTPTTLGPPKEHRHGPTVGSWVGAVSYERGTPVCR